MRMMRCKAASIYIVDRASKTMRVVEIPSGRVHSMPIGNGLAGRVAVTGQAMTAAELRGCDGYDPAVDHPFCAADEQPHPADSVLCLPVMPHRQDMSMPTPTAVLTVYGRRTSQNAPFTVSEMRLLAVIGAQASLMLSHCATHDALATAYAKECEVTDSARSLCTVQNEQAMLPKAVDSVTAILGAEKVTVFMAPFASARQAKAAPTAASGTAEDSAVAEEAWQRCQSGSTAIEPAVLRGAARRVADEPSFPFNISDISTHPLFKNSSKPLALLCCAVCDESGLPIGVVEAVRASPPFSAAEAHTLQRAGTVLGVALRNSRQQKRAAWVQEMLCRSSGFVQMEDLHALLAADLMALLECHECTVFVRDRPSNSFWYFAPAEAAPASQPEPQQVWKRSDRAMAFAS